MKKIIMSTLAIAMMMTMASCSSSDNDVAENITENELQKMTFTAICENSVGTRAKLDSENKVLWEQGDQIGINGLPYSLEEGAGTTKGVFSGSSQQTKYIAVYPYKERWSPSSNFEALNIPFPSEQTATEGTFDKDAALMVAYSDNGSTTLEFKNVGALVKVKPKFNCNKIVLNAGDESVPLAGKGTLSYNGGNPKFTINSEKAYSITLNGSIEKDKTYYIAVPTVTLAPGWSISFTDNAGDVYTRTGSNEIEFKRNTIINLGEFSRTDEKLKLTLKENGNVPADKQVDMGVFNIDGTNYRLIFTKSNLTATGTGLAASESDYGDYFAWGAIKPWYEKITSTSNSVTADSWETSKSDGYIESNAPYYKSGSSVDDNIEYLKYTETGSILEDRDDAAKQILQGNWQVPSATIWQQLYDSGKNTKFEWKWNESNKGYYITNKENNNTIFLPAAGDFWKKECGLLGTHGHYWSNTTLSSNKSIYLYFSESNIYYDWSNNRYYGFSIRPVRLVAVD